MEDKDSDKGAGDGAVDLARVALSLEKGKKDIPEDIRRRLLAALGAESATGAADGINDTAASAELPVFEACWRTDWLRDKLEDAGERLSVLTRELGLLLLTRPDLEALDRDRGLIGYLVVDRVNRVDTRSEAAAIKVIIESWSNWKGDHSEESSLRLHTLLEGLHAERGSLMAIADAIGAIRLRADPDLDAQVRCRTARLGREIAAWLPDTPRPAQQAILKNVALFLAAEALAFTLAIWRSRVDAGVVARASINAWRGINQKDGETIAEFLARAGEVYRLTGMGHEPANREVFERVRPQLRRFLEQNVYDTIANVARINNRTMALLAIIDEGHVVASMDWLLADTTMSRADFRILLEWADRRAPHSDHRAETQLAAMESKRQAINKDIICAACGGKGHPFFRCTTATPAQKEAAAARVGYRRSSSANRPAAAAAARVGNQPSVKTTTQPGKA
jgi:hypothetical protein